MKPLLIAHRGGKYWQGDNFSYISESIKAGADIIEFDIRLKNNVLIIQHDKFAKIQGKLTDALKKIKDKAIYLDIKDDKINPNKLIDFVKQKKVSSIIIGSFNPKILKKINDNDVIINYHCYPFLMSIKKAKEVKADWINPMPYFITKNKIKKIFDNGFKFVPAGSENYNKQLKYAKMGAYAISVYDIKKFKKLLKENDA